MVGDALRFDRQLTRIRLGIRFRSLWTCIVRLAISITAIRFPIHFHSTPRLVRAKRVVGLGEPFASTMIWWSRMER